MQPTTFIALLLAYATTITIASPMPNPQALTVETTLFVRETDPEAKNGETRKKIVEGTKKACSAIKEFAKDCKQAWDEVKEEDRKAEEAAEAEYVRKHGPRPKYEPMRWSPAAFAEE